MMTTAPQRAPVAAGLPAKWALCEVLLIFVVFFIHAGWPVPEVNETHYLCKAKHYWDPTWCPRDFFLQTADAHQTFYWTFGWWTLWMSLPAFAWAGRVITWGLQAWAWQRLSSTLLPARLVSVLTAATMLALNSRLHMAGEWIIGGFEAKGIAYALAWFGMTALLRGKWFATWLWLGAASAWHVVIGGWSVIASFIAWLLSHPAQRPGLLALAPALGLGLILALPGLVPGLLLKKGTPPEVSAEADRIQVFERLPHHLLPSKIPPLVIGRHVLLIAIWCWLAWKTRSPAPAWQRLRSIILGALLIAAAGICLTILANWFPTFAYGMLRYYCFRLSDVLVPAGVAFLIAAWLLSLLEAQPQRGSIALAATLLLVGGHYADTIWQRQTLIAQGKFGPPGDAKLPDLADWQSVCRWISTSDIPRDAIFFVPRMGSSFRWYADRGDAVNYKDMPQDATGVVDWWERLQDIYRGSRIGGYWRPFLSELTEPRLLELAQKYHVDYLLVESEFPLRFPKVGPSDKAYTIYRLVPLPSE